MHVARKPRKISESSEELDSPPAVITGRPRRATAGKRVSGLSDYEKDTGM